MSKAEMATSPSEKKKGKFDDYEVESFARTLHEAEEIKADPAKLKAAHGHMKKKLKATKKAITSISGIRQAHQDKFGDEAESDDS